MNSLWNGLINKVHSFTCSFHHMIQWGWLMVEWFSIFSHWNWIYWLCAMLTTILGHSCSFEWKFATEKRKPLNKRIEIDVKAAMLGGLQIETNINSGIILENLHKVFAFRDKSETINWHFFKFRWWQTKISMVEVAENLLNLYTNLKIFLREINFGDWFRGPTKHRSHRRPT